MAAEIGALGANRSVPADARDERRARLQRATMRLTLLTDWLAAAVAVSLPWSTSATSILIVLWLMAALPTLESRSLRWAFAPPAGALPVLLWALGLVGMPWSDVTMSERLAGLSGYHKLLVVPLLLAQFRGRREGKLVLLSFIASCTALLVLSWALVLIPNLPWRGRNVPGVPVKDYILQSALFSICAFGLMGQVASVWQTRPKLAVALTMLAAAISSAAWFSSSYLRERVWHAIEDVQTYGPTNVNTSEGQRFEYWRKSLGFIREAPLIGHGTGSIPYLFRSHATPETHPNTITTNPHNQVFVIAIELGILGTAVLLATWGAHLWLFRAPGLLSWFGLIVVLQNIISSSFNSHLFDFTQGWLYVFAVGVLGGMVQSSRPLDD